MNDALLEKFANIDDLFGFILILDENLEMCSSTPDLEISPYITLASMPTKSLPMLSATSSDHQESIAARVNVDTVNIGGSVSKPNTPNPYSRVGMWESPSMMLSAQSLNTPTSSSTPSTAPTTPSK